MDTPLRYSPGLLYLEVEIDLNAIHLLGIGPKFKQTGSNIEEIGDWRCQVHALCSIRSTLAADEQRGILSSLSSVAFSWGFLVQSKGKRKGV